MPQSLETRLKTMIDDAAQGYDEARTSNLLRRIWQSDRESDYTAFRRTAGLCADELRDIGLQDVEVFDCPADGKTRMQAWTMPLAWEGGQAVLRITEPQEEVLCDRTVDPLSCAMWSEPTPEGGVRGPLVVVDDPEAISAADRAKLRGAFILTEKTGRGPMKVFASDVGAAAVVSQFVAHVERHPQATGWSNGWSDDSGGWALKASDCRMTCFQISPPVGQRLRDLVSKGPVTCEAHVGGRVGEGTLPVVTGVLPGETDEEILLTGHLYEIGVIDNASGCAAMIEIMRLLAALPRLKRTVRILLTSECYGTYAFYTLRPELLKKTLAGLNLDGVCEIGTPERPIGWHRTSEACPSAIDSLFRAAMRLTEGFPGALPTVERSHGISDNMLNDPAVGVPMIGTIRGPYHWHTSADDWTQYSSESQCRMTVASAAFTRWLAEAGDDDADALAEQAAQDTRTLYGTQDTADDPQQSYFFQRGQQRVLWTRQLGAQNIDTVAENMTQEITGSAVDEVGGDDEARCTVPSRTFWGAPTFDNIPAEEREGLTDPRWDMARVTACYWIDGKRTVQDIANLVRAEYGQSPDLMTFFRVLERGGLVRLSHV